MINVNMNMNISQLLSDLTNIETKINNLVNKTYTVKVKADTSGLTTTIDNAVKQASGKVVNTTSNNKALTLQQQGTILSNQGLNSYLSNMNKFQAEATLKSIQSLQQFNSSLQGTSSMFAPLKTALEGMKSGISMINTGFTDLNSGVKQVVSGFRDLLLPAIMLVSKVMKESVEQAKIQARMNSVMLLDQEESNQYLKMARQISNGTGLDTPEVLKVGYEFNSSGGQKELTEFMMKMGSTAISSSFVQDPQSYIRAVTTVGNVYGAESEKDYYEIMNSIAWLDMTSPMNADKFASMSAKEFSNYKMNGFSMYDVFALTNLEATNRGAKGISQGMTQFITRANRPSGDMMEVLKELNLDAYEDLSSSALQKKGLVKYFRDFETALNNYNGDKAWVIDQMFGNKGASGTFKTIMGNVDELEQKLEEVRNSTALKDQTESYQESTYGKYMKMTATLNNAFAKLGDTLIPIFIEIGTTIANIIDKIANFCNNNEKLVSSIVKGIAIFAVFAGVMFIIGGIIKVVTGLFFIFKGIIEIASGVVRFFQGVLIILNVVFGISGSLVLGLTLLIAGLGYIIWFCATNTSSATDFMKMAFWALAGGISEIVYIIGVILKSLVGVAESVAQSIVNAIIWAVNTAGQNLNAFIGGVSPMLGNALNVLGIDLKFDFKPIANIEIDQASGAIDTALKWLEGKQDEIQKKMETIAGGELKLNPFDGIIEKIKKMFTSDDGKPFDANALMQEITDGLNDFGDNGEFIPGDIGDLYDDLYGDTDKDKDLEEHKQAVESMASSIKSLADGYKDAIDMLDKYTKKVINSNSIMKNNRTAKSVVLEWAEVQNKLLSNAGLSSELKAYISQMKPDQLAELKAISKLSGSELSEFDKNYQTIVATSQAQSNANIINIEVQSDKDDKTYKKFAEDVIKELKRLGVKLA